MEITPRNHNKEYKEAQDEYLKKPFGEREQNILARMYEIAQSYLCNNIINYTHSHGIRFSDSKIMDLSHDGATWIVENYLRRPEFKIEKLSSYGNFAKLKILYGDKDWEMKTTSYESLIENGGEHYIDENGETFWDFAND